MGVAPTLIFIILAYLSPADLFPTFGQYRIQLWFALPAAVFAVLGLVGSQYQVKMPQVYLFLGLIFAVGFSRFANHFIGASVAGVGEFLVSSVVLYLVLFNFRSLRSLRLLAISIAVIGIYFTTQGIIFLLASSGDSLAVMNSYAYSADGHFEVVRRIRAGGFLSDPNDLAQFLLVGTALLGVAWGKNVIARFIYVILPGSYLFLGVTLTRSRGGLLGLAALLSLAMMDRVGRVKSLILAGLAAVAMVGLNVAGGRSISMEGGSDRLDIWRDAWGLFKNSPLWGVGYNWFTHPAFGSQRLERTAHNSFVLCFTELGVIGLFFWLGLIVYSYAQLNAVLRLEAKNDLQRDIQRYARAMRVALSTFLVTGWFLSRTYTITFYILIGAIGALVVLMRNETDSPTLSNSPKWLVATAFSVLACVVFVFLTLKLRNIVL